MNPDQVTAVATVLTAAFAGGALLLQWRSQRRKVSFYYTVKLTTYPGNPTIVEIVLRLRNNLDVSARILRLTVNDPPNVQVTASEMRKDASWPANAAPGRSQIAEPGQTVATTYSIVPDWPNWTHKWPSKVATPSGHLAGWFARRSAPRHRISLTISIERFTDRPRKTRHRIKVVISTDSVEAAAAHMASINVKGIRVPS